ncbi:hypothetical protein FN976_05725 [Caenimonas sedimenti]|uniref:Uncharacterized protein n=1 Tax=Caenimonas sedimenti TaxID=2596921 RepID=A0A562ZV64_9BURK|nr:hypothetical protein [Caenimonas sedimenti]TWO72205.1 hypothetical protein FN976_05725 [Caenimonas sedimenti]
MIVGLFGAVFIVLGLDREPGWPIWMLSGGIITCAALFAFLVALRMTLSVMRFGKVHLYLESEARVGAPLKALVRLPASMAGSAARVELESLRFTRKRGDESMQNEVIWSIARLFPIRARRGAAYADIRLDIPEERAATDLPETVRRFRQMDGHGPGSEIERGTTHYDWELHLRVEVPGVDLERTYHLKVLPQRTQAAPPALDALPSS